MCFHWVTLLATLGEEFSVVRLQSASLSVQLNVAAFPFCEEEAVHAPHLEVANTLQEVEKVKQSGIL